MNITEVVRFKLFHQFLHRCRCRWVDVEAAVCHFPILRPNEKAPRESVLLAIRWSRLLEGDSLSTQIYFGQEFLFHFPATMRNISQSDSIVAC